MKLTSTVNNQPKEQNNVMAARKSYICTSDTLEKNVGCHCRSSACVQILLIQISHVMVQVYSGLEVIGANGFVLMFRRQ